MARRTTRHEINGAGLSYACDVTTCTLEPVIDWPGATYKVWLRAWGPGGMSEWAQGPDLALPTTPPDAPANIAVNATGDPVITWDASDNATWYEVWVTTPSYATAYREWHLGEDIGCPVYPGSCAVSGMGLAAGSYKVYIRAWGRAA